MELHILAERLRRWRGQAGIGPPLVGLCLGIAALQWQPALPAPWSTLLSWTGLSLLAAFGLGWLRWPGSGPRTESASGPGGDVRALVSLLAGLVFAMAIGFSWAAWRADTRLDDALPVEWERRDIELVGVIAELPREFERGRRFVFLVDQVMTPEARVPRRILLSWYAGAHEDQWLDDRALLPGERWRFTVRLKRPHGHANPGGFDYEAWLLEHDLRATGYVRATPAAMRLGEEWTIPTTIERLRARLRQHLQKILGDAAYGGVVIALALGDQGSIANEHWRVFAATGTTHLMSISGLHVTMMAVLFGGLVNFFWRRWPRAMLRLPAQRASVWSGWLAALLYTLLAGAGIPAVRTLLMLSVAALAHTLDRQVGTARVLLLALVAVLLVDPWAVLVIGFWLSFAAVAVLLFFAGDDAGPAQAQGSSGRQPVSLRAWQLLRRWGWSQWVVTLGTVPLVLAMFQYFSLASPLANALAIPLVGFLIAPLSVAAALLPVPGLAELAHFGLQCLMIPLDWLAAQPWALWRQAEPPAWTVGLAVIGVVLHLWITALLWRSAALLLLGPLLFLPAPRPAPGEVWLDLLDVGHGLSVVVRTAERTLLFDAGPRYSPEASAGDRLVLPALRAMGVARLDGLVVSHRDNDHAGGVSAVTAELPVTWLASSLADDHPLRVAAGSQHHQCAAGRSFEWDGVRFRFLSPPSAYYDIRTLASNRMSCVLLIETASRRALLTADAELPEERAMQQAGWLQTLDFLQVPHQGSRSSSGEDFVRAVAPRVAAFPVGYRNPFSHPHPEVVERYRAAGSTLFRTDRDGAVHVALSDSMVVQAYRASHPRYWHDGRPGIATDRD